MDLCPSSTLYLHTSWGRIRVTVADGIVRTCELPARGDTISKALVLGRAQISASSKKDEKVLLQSEAFIRAMFSGKPFPVPSCDALCGTAFQRRVWSALERCPAGRTLSYGDVARLIGSPRAMRAVGQACAANPLPLFVPCHRVLAAGGKLGGFSGGLAWKKRLLALEQSGQTSKRRPS